MKIKNWIACVQDRGKWKEVVEKVKTFNYRTFSAWKKKNGPTLNITSHQTCNFEQDKNVF